MKQHYQDFYFTLDLDNIDYRTAYQRFIRIIKEQPVHRVVLYFSAVKGFHIEAFTNRLVQVAAIRKQYGDDGARLVHDLLDRCDSKYHDVLWQEKQLGPYTFKQQEIESWRS